MERFVSIKRMRATAHEPIRLNRDLVRYRKGYPGEALNSSENDNVRFYLNQKKSRPRGEFIDTIHETWATDYDELERNHGYIQWLFPIHEHGVNDLAQVLQRHEAKTMRENPEIQRRIKKSYSMMLGFYGAEIVNWETGELARAANFAARFDNLNRKWHNFLRITRILKFLGEVDFEYLKLPFLTFFAREALVHRTLPSIIDSLRNYWAGTLKDDSQLEQFLGLLDNPSRLEESVKKKGLKSPESEAGARSADSKPEDQDGTFPKTRSKQGPANSNSQLQDRQQSQATTVAADEEELDPDSVPLSDDDAA